jgi:hypothetical protein
MPNCLSTTRLEWGEVASAPLESKIPWNRSSRIQAILQADDVLGLKTLRSLLHFKFNRLAFIQTLVTVSLDRREVHEHIFTGLALDETIAFCRVEPLDCTLLSAHCECS